MSILRKELEIKNPSFYQRKDQFKINEASKFIGHGSTTSSTEKYRKMFDRLGLANTSQYTEEDIVFISVEGARKNRKPLDTSEVKLALEARSTIICDNLEARTRPYNVGERELYNFLTENNYEEAYSCSFYSLFKPKNN